MKNYEKPNLYILDLGSSLNVLSASGGSLEDHDNDGYDAKWILTSL